MTTHSERVAKIRAYTEKNKLFTVIVIIVIVTLIGNFIVNKVSEVKARDIAASSVSSETDETAEVSEVADDISDTEEKPVDTNINQKEKPKWRFYWIDLWILAGGGGFCIIKILQEKKKAREKL